MSSSRANDRRPLAVVSGIRFRTLIALGATFVLTSGAREPRQPELLLAYVDPGSAGFVIVSLLGFLSAVGYTLRNALGRLLARLPGGRRQGATGDRPNAPDDAVPPPS